MATEIILVPRMAKRQNTVQPRLVIHAVAAAEVRGYAAAEWSENHRQHPAAVFGHVATTACWPVTLEMWDHAGRAHDVRPRERLPCSAATTRCRIPPWRSVAFMPTVTRNP